MSKTLEAPTIVKDKKQRHKEWMEEEVYFEFFNLEEPGVPIKFSFGTTRNAEKHSLMHGGKYRKKRSVVQHLESRQTPLWGYKPDGRGQMQKDLEGYKSRFQCRQLFE
jgi:hypothetical protein